MTPKELPARAANIQRAVASTTACTSATVESLRSFLAPVLTPVSQQKPLPSVPLPKVKGSSARPVKATVARSGKRPPVTILEIPGEQCNQLQPQHKLVLATEVVNATLKSLTDAIKDSPARKVTQTKRDPLARTPSISSSSNGHESRSQTPLQPLCVNRLPVSPGKQNGSRRSSATLSTKQTMDGLRAQAECARIAFATLRSLQWHRGSTTALPYLQLESGMSALIGKMLALGFDDIGLRELRILKRRLEASEVTSPGQGTAASAASWKGEEQSESRIETLAEMLRFRNISARGQLLSLMVTTQLQVLKILARRKDASVIEIALQHLQFSAPHSPANLIRQQREPNVPESEVKVARQLESLAQSLIALCPTSSVTNGKSFPLDIHISPEITFQIQVLALQVRSTWWQISGHQSDIVKEIVGPFTQCLANYSGRSRSSKAEKYEIATRAFENLKECVQNVKGFREKGLFSIYQLLAESAQDSSQHFQAIRWVRKAEECARESTLSRVQLCNLKCRLASLELQLPDSEASDKPTSLLGDAAKSLEGDLKGESAELDELLLSVAGLRRSAFCVFQSSYRSSKTKEKRVQPSLIHQCSAIVLLCARFLVRYVGNGNSGEGHEKTVVRRDQRKRLGARFALSTIESVAAIARLSADSEADVWDSLDIGLQDCSRLAATIADCSTDAYQATSENNRASPFLSISNAYWHRYQCLKRGATDPKSCKECLLMSIRLIRDHSLCERLAGSLPMKLEKLGQLYEDIRDYEKAATSYEEALRMELESDLLRRALGTAALQSMATVLEPESELLPLSRRLSAYHKAASKAIDQGSRRALFYNAKGLSPNERGVLLELQLVSLLSVLNAQSPTPKTYNALNDIGMLLLMTYEHDKFPVRRLRVIIRLLSSLLIAPSALRNDLTDILLEEPEKPASETHFDTCLLSLQPHLLTCRCLLINLRQKPPNIKDLESVITSWSKLIQGNVDWASLQAYVYDVADWLIQLEMLSEYLDMQGLELYRVSVLNIAILVHEAALPVQCSALVLKLSELGSQHVRLGYSALAGSVLHKAQRYLEASDLSNKIRLKWHLSYAEYALGNRNLKTW